ncbi:MAG: hypothetical protein AAFV72_14970 [Cyanobacteria bacterium J06635_1]
MLSVPLFPITHHPLRTFIKAMLGLVPTHRGQVLLDACPLCRQSHRVAYVPQRSQTVSHPAQLIGHIRRGPTTK